MSDDPLIDLRHLPGWIPQDIQDWVDKYLNDPRFERRVGFLGITIRRDPFIRHSKLMAAFARFTELSVASERAMRQQAAEIEAESDLALAQGRAGYLREVGLSTQRSEAVAEQVQRQREKRNREAHEGIAVVRRRGGRGYIFRLVVIVAGLVLGSTPIGEMPTTPLPPAKPHFAPAARPKRSPPPARRFAFICPEATVRELETALDAARAKSATLVADNAVLRRAAGVLTLGKDGLLRRLDELSAQVEELKQEKPPVGRKAGRAA